MNHLQIGRTLKITRKEFLKKAWGLIILPYLVFLVLMVRRHGVVSSPGQIRISGPIPEGVTFYGDIVCIKENNELTAFSSRCTHLGCRINKSEGDRLICPCHGSEFNSRGQVVKGPALNALQELSYTVDSSNREILIDLNL